jgi:hypothetical protein
MTHNRMHTIKVQTFRMRENDPVPLLLLQDNITLEIFYIDMCSYFL